MRVDCVHFLALHALIQSKPHAIQARREFVEESHQSGSAACTLDPTKWQIVIHFNPTPCQFWQTVSVASNVTKHRLTNTVSVCTMRYGASFSLSVMDGRLNENRSAKRFAL